MKLEENKLLEVKHLIVFYENSIAINNISLDCDPHKITGVFGANSAGKSTLMYTISGIILDKKEKEEMRGGERINIFGEILFKGEDISGVIPSTRAKKGIVLCPERRRLFSESTVLENLKMGGYLATWEQAKKTLEIVFEIFPQLIALRKREAGFLSGGEQQQVAIGRALMAQPKLLLLDEPLLGLSPNVERKLTKAIKAINEKIGLTILISEQYARPILPIIDYGYILENGNLVLEGKAEEFKNNPDIKTAYLGV